MARPNRSRGRILDAALQVAATEGVSATTMEAIAERAGVAKGSLYYNFSSKDELFAAALGELGDQLLDHLDEVLGAGEGIEALRAVTATALRLLHESPELAAVLPSELMRTDRPWNDTTERLRRRLLELARRTVATARPELAGDEPTAPPSVTGDPLAFSATALLGSILLIGGSALHRQPADDPDRAADGIVAALVPVTPA